MTKHTLGLGCWAIGGPFYMGDRPVGWGEVDDATSIRAIHTALDHGITLFDTAQAYGTGHSETILGQALRDRPDAAIITKVGLGIHAKTRQITGQMTDPDAIRASLDASQGRLGRDHIDTVLLHLNDLPTDEAAPIFDLLGDLHREGRIGSYGWSTDLPDRATAFADRPGFTAIEHAMNVFFRADQLVPVIRAAGLTGYVRSPLAMGILGGRYDKTSTFKGEIRAANDDWNGYFKDGRITDDHLAQLDAVRSILTSGGRSLAQGAIAWLWARSDSAVPIPGFRTPDQVIDLCGAVEFGPLTPDQMSEIEAVLDRPLEGPPRPR